MARRPQATGSPLVLLINDEEWTARSLETILKPHGYAVLMAYTGRAALELSTRVRPDAILVDLRLPDMEGRDVCARLRQMPTVRPSTPILAFSSGAMSRRERLSCLRVGAWEVFHPPFDPDELLTRIGTYVAAKQDADVAREASHEDSVTGFYNIRGLSRRVTEITADASRHERPLACVVFGSDAPEAQDQRRDETSVPEAQEMPRDERADAALVRGVANALVSVTRLSDVVARVGGGEFVIVAPGTDEPGAVRLAERILDVVESDPTRFGLSPNVRLRAGFHAVAEPHRETVIPEELLSRATTALRQAQTEGNGVRVRAFESDAEH